MGDRVYIGLGSNLGDRERELVLARDALERVEGIQVLRSSSVYESAPVGPPQPRFLNAVAELECSLDPHALLLALQEIEHSLGRERAQRWGPRVIDLDILLWGGRVIADSNLCVPHRELQHRRFALEPLAELIPNARHPILGKSVQELLERVLEQDVVKWHPSELLQLSHRRRASWALSSS
jgi:2-amino-4-hydroxy-6-hydroxymethyldihydropteridine diphosphokinase